MRTDLKKLIEECENDLSRHLDAKKLWLKVKAGKRPSDETLDRLALFAGFQNWQELKETLHGETDASVNYNDER